VQLHCIYAVFVTNLLDGVFVVINYCFDMFRPVLGHLQEARKFIDACNLCVNLCGTDSTQRCTNIIKITIKIKLIKLYLTIK